MSSYQVSGEKPRKFKLTANGEALGELQYPKWFSNKAEIRLPGSSVLQLTTLSGWSLTTVLKDQERVLLSLKMNWKGQVIINSHPEDAAQQLTLKVKSYFKNAYMLNDAEGRELAVVHTDFKWRKFSYDFHLETTEAFERLALKTPLLLVMIHSIGLVTQASSYAGI